MAGATFTLQKIQKIFDPEINRNTLIKAEERGDIPSARREDTGAVKRRTWSLSDLPKIGEQYGYLKKPDSPVCATVFVTKGGVLKTTLTMNIARMAALHNIKTCIVGLDMQADVTNAFGINLDNEQADSLEEAVSADINPGLFDYYNGSISLDECLVQTDIPTLSLIPESSELVALEAKIQSETRREYWIKEQVIEPLKKKFDLVLIDCPPSWNMLISNALTASDALISPLECKINHYRNTESFLKFIKEFKKKAKIDFRHIFVATKHSSQRKLSGEIRKFYISEIPNCITTSIRESTLGEEATAMSVSFPEQAPGKVPAEEMKEAITEIWDQILEIGKVKNTGAQKHPHIDTSAGNRENSVQL